MGLTGWLIFTGVILVLGALAAWLLTRPTRRARARTTEVTQRLAAAQRREDGRTVVGDALRKPPHVVPRVPKQSRQGAPAAVPDPAVGGYVDFTSPTVYPGGSAYTAGAWHSSHHGPASSGAETGGSVGHSSGGTGGDGYSGSSSGGYDGGSSSGGYDSGSSGGGSDGGGSW